jgi:hypothetical protein
MRTQITKNYKNFSSTLVCGSLLSCSLLILSGCSFLGDSTPEVLEDRSNEDTTFEDENEDEIEQDGGREASLQIRRERSTSVNRALYDDIEVIWEIPKTQVDGFIIEYGRPNSTSHKRERVQTAQLERFDHPRFGYVYRHTLRGVPSTSEVEVFIRAYRDETISESSQAIIVPPRIIKDSKEPWRTEQQPTIR